mmetsp:Transcript_59548/g.104157  ORF Transcript_59548/g.104157 Transcript_59548/m.104157 type:complete len:123 (+) Transcript_59548:95-463(+)
MPHIAVGLSGGSFEVAGTVRYTPSQCRHLEPSSVLRPRIRPKMPQETKPPPMGQPTERVRSPRVRSRPERGPLLSALNRLDSNIILCLQQRLHLTRLPLNRRKQMARSPRAASTLHLGRYWR